MGKIKTHKASAKRFSVTANGKVKMFRASHRHNTGNKSANTNTTKMVILLES